ncbi:MAG TPA: SOS response-associated peptidase [Pseudorhizobium sp.]|nr:SOS response-associated peptidase [Pseudorhizobium sp.]
MCGRYALTATPEEILHFLSVIDIEEFPPRYNIAPTQPVLVVASAEPTSPGSNLPDRRTLLARWGFIPGWVKDPADFPLLINARAETASEKASFRGALRHRRVLVPASGYYEWRRPPKESRLPSQAYWIKPRGGGLVAFGGLLETFASADGSEIDTAAILTTNANHALRGIHDRMPVVIPQDAFSRWLDCKTQEPRAVVDLMQPAADAMFEAVPVSDLVNKVANMGPELQKPVPLAEPLEPSASPAKHGAQLSLF